MKYVNEFRDGPRIRATIAEIRRTLTRPWTIMEVCGGQTHSIVKNGLDEKLYDSPAGPDTISAPMGCITWACRRSRRN